MKPGANEEAGPGKAPVARSSAPVSPGGLTDRWAVSGVCILLVAIIWAVFGQTLRHEFVNLDDDQYVTENPVVQRGVTWEGFRWALTYGEIGHWHPLTWLSHMLDCQLYGLNPAGHHLTNILLHTLAAILLFLVFRQMTGFLWRSAFVAAVFAIHPLRVESVAWVAERKDVLSATFFMLTLGAYVRYAQGQSNIESRGSSAPTAPILDSRRSTFDYCLMLFFFALGLLSKNMLVTMPFVLLLLDYWPLNRLSPFSPRVLLWRVAEKVPLFLLTVGSCVATFLVPEKPSSELPFGLGLENALASYVTYLWQMIHPSGLACVYPNPVNHLPFWQVAGALGFLLAISGTVWAFRMQRPWLVVGWLWYLGMMIPVIGIVQISYYAHADRYTYLPQIGLYLLLTWAAADLSAGCRRRRVMLGGLAAVILVALIYCARSQTAYWQNSETLFRHALEVTERNFTAYNNLGIALDKKGQIDEAISQYQEAIRLKPDFAKAHNNLGNSLDKKSQINEAVSQYREAIRLKPDYAIARNNLGNSLVKKGQSDEAISQYREAIRLKPDCAEAHNNLGFALERKGQIDEAISQCQEAVYLKSDYAEAYNDLGTALAAKGRFDEAIENFQKTIQINSHSSDALHNLGVALAAKGQLDEAVKNLQKAIEVNPTRPETFLHLGMTLGQLRRTSEAVAQYREALRLNPDLVSALNNLAWVLATSPDDRLRNGAEAARLAERACGLTHLSQPLFIGTLAAAYAECSRFPEAVTTAEKAERLAVALGQPVVAAKNRQLLELYRAGKPFHESPPPKP